MRPDPPRNDIFRHLEEATALFDPRTIKREHDRAATESESVRRRLQDLLRKE